MQAVVHVRGRRSESAAQRPFQHGIEAVMTATIVVASTASHASVEPPHHFEVARASPKSVKRLSIHVADGEFRSAGRRNAEFREFF